MLVRIKKIHNNYFKIDGTQITLKIIKGYIKDGLDLSVINQTNDTDETDDTYVKIYLAQIMNENQISQKVIDTIKLVCNLDTIKNVIHCNDAETYLIRNKLGFSSAKTIA